jgi:3' terminal RNA ribose 2'-O-methyltransferase Hen1
MSGENPRWRHNPCMLLSISTTHRPATDLGYLLHKNPARCQSFNLTFGTAQVFYPDASDDLCTAVLLVEVDPIGLVRGKHGERAFSLQQYVNDRPYAASSFLSVAIGQVYRSAMGGTSESHQHLADAPIPLSASLPVVPAREGEGLVRDLFEPLGYTVTMARGQLDPLFPEWGESPYVSLRLDGDIRLQDLLAHLYVLVPVLDNDKHYWIGQDEIDKLLRRGGEWLRTHPHRDTIVSRYLSRRRSLARDALARLAEEADVADEVQATGDDAETTIERPLSLHEHRHAAVLAELTASGAHSVLDLGCGEGRLLEALLKDGQFTRIVGMDVSFRALERASERLHLDTMAERQRARIELIHGSLIYRDRRLAGFDAAAVVEVIEHLDPERLASFERVVFEFSRPGSVIVTTPNAEYNVVWKGLSGREFRHLDHRFEWARAEFHDWASAIANRFGYSVRFAGIGPTDPDAGSPTQMAVFRRD